MRCMLYGFLYMVSQRQPCLHKEQIRIHSNDPFSHCTDLNILCRKVLQQWRWLKQRWSKCVRAQACMWLRTSMMCFTAIFKALERLEGWRISLVWKRYSWKEIQYKAFRACHHAIWHACKSPWVCLGRASVELTNSWCEDLGYVSRALAHIQYQAIKANPCTV